MAGRGLDGHIVLVAGGATGIGATSVVAFAEAGADVALLYHGREPTGGLLGEVRATGRRVALVRADVGSEAHVAAAMDQAAAAALGDGAVLPVDLVTATPDAGYRGPSILELLDDDVADAPSAEDVAEIVVDSRTVFERATERARS